MQCESGSLQLLVGRNRQEKTGSNCRIPRNSKQARAQCGICTSFVHCTLALLRYLLPASRNDCVSCGVFDNCAKKGLVTKMLAQTIARLFYFQQLQENDGLVRSICVQLYYFTFGRPFQPCQSHALTRHVTHLN